MGRTCLRPRAATTAERARKATLSRLTTPQRRNTAQSCSSGCGSITGGMPTGRAGWLCQPSRRRAGSLRRGQALTHRGHPPRPPAAAGSRGLRRGTGTATRIRSVSQHPSLTMRRPSTAQPQHQLMPDQPSSRTGIRLRQVGAQVLQREPRCCLQQCVGFILCKLGHECGGKQA